MMNHIHKQAFFHKKEKSIYRNAQGIILESLKNCIQYIFVPLATVKHFFSTVRHKTLFSLWAFFEET